jgi:hypothetical protein
MTRTRIPGLARRNSASRGSSQKEEKATVAPIVTTSWLRDWIASTLSAISAKLFASVAPRLTQAGVGSIARCLRRNSGWPSSSSSDAICLLTAA